MSESSKVVYDPKKAEDLAKEINALLIKKFGYRPSFVLVYSEENYSDFHWITNVKREEGILLARETVKKMQAEIT